MAAVVGFQSPYNDQRSVIALLADSPRGYELLNTAMNDSGKRAAMFGSVSVIRESGVNSLRVGDVLRRPSAVVRAPVVCAVEPSGSARHPAAVSVVLLAWVLWRLLRIISRRRLNPDE